MLKRGLSSLIQPKIYMLIWIFNHWLAALKDTWQPNHFSMINNAGEPSPNIVKICWQLYYVESRHAAQHFVNTTILWG